MEETSHTNQTTTKTRLAYKLSEASTLLGVPVSTLRKRIREGRINVIIGIGPWLISQKEIDRILSQTLRNEQEGGER